ncbi:MAG: hypothetical protein RR060_07585 [Victivallaceae bacterium]
MMLGFAELWQFFWAFSLLGLVAIYLWWRKSTPPPTTTGGTGLLFF